MRRGGGESFVGMQNSLQPLRRARYELTEYDLNLLSCTCGDFVIYQGLDTRPGRFRGYGESGSDTFLYTIDCIYVIIGRYSLTILERVSVRSWPCTAPCAVPSARRWTASTGLPPPHTDGTYPPLLQAEWDSWHVEIDHGCDAIPGQIWADLTWADVGVLLHERAQLIICSDMMGRTPDTQVPYLVRWKGTARRADRYTLWGE